MSLAEKMALWVDNDDVAHEGADHDDLFDGVIADEDEGFDTTENSHKYVIIPRAHYMYTTL
jgi:hypothetical protein